VPSKSND